MLKYNDFLTKEGILDVITVDYDRVKNDSFYGYVLQIKFNFSNFKRREVVWAISYFTILLLASGSLLLSLLL